MRLQSGTPAGLPWQAVAGDSLLALLLSSPQLMLLQSD